MNNDNVTPLDKLKFVELENLYSFKVKQGYTINPELNFKGFKGRITKARWIWAIENLVKL
jgi:hypothetical protein